MVKKTNITIILLAVFSFLLFNNVHAERSPNLLERPLTEVLDDFGNKYDVFFSYEKSMIEDIQVNFEFIENENLISALDRLLHSFNLNYDTFGDKYIVIYKKTEAADKDLTKLRKHFKEIEKIESEGRIKIFRKKGKKESILNQISKEVTKLSSKQSNAPIIEGRVTDTDGESLIGVNVLIKGTSTGTVTDFDGKYSIEAGSDAVLVFSYTGYKDQDVLVGSQTNINVTMTANVSILDEVVVVGYGTVRKTDLSGAVNQVKGEDLTKTPANTFVHSLQGRAAGVDIKAASNAPGGGIRIRIRGTNSINASSTPLYVIDGFPIDNDNTTPGGTGNNAFAADPMSSISPNEIASIEILKDASATAIYGSRGANGVVIITTKRGQEGKAQIDFDYNVNIANVRKRMVLANAQELAELTNEWATNNDRPLIYDGVNKPRPEELGEGTDWQEEVFRTALTHTYNLVFSGGTKNTKYLLSGNYLDQDGIIIESNFKRAGIKFNLDQKITNKINFGFNLNSVRSINDAVPSDASGVRNDSPLWNALTQTPVNSVFDEDGNFLHNHDESVKQLENPVSIATTRSDITTTNRTLSTAFFTYEPLSGLTFKANFGADIRNIKRSVYLPTTAQTQGLPNVGSASIGNVKSNIWLAEYTLNYEKELGDHRFNILAGYTIQSRNTEDVYSQSNDFFTDKLEFNNLAVGSNPRPATSNVVETGLISTMGRINYVFQNKYIVTGTIRRDGSSKFGRDNKWGVFPSVALAWRLSEESFLNGSSVLTDAKIRASYGVTGNEAIKPYQTLSLYQNNTTIIGGNPVIGLFPNRVPNPALKWEKTAQTNIGVDLEFFEGKVNFTTDYYYKKTSDLLLNVSIPTQSGYGSSTQNVGEVENKGFEFSIGYRHNFGPVSWSTSAHVTANRNKVLALTDGVERLLFTMAAERGETNYGRTIVRPGLPLGSFWGYRFLGIWDSQEEIAASGVTGNVGRRVQVGLPQYADLGGRPGWNNEDADREVVGDPNPDFIYGWSNDFSYKNLTLSIFINGSYGNEIANLNRIGLLGQPQKHNVLKRVYDERWTGPGTSTTIEAPLTNGPEWKNFSDRDVEDGTYLRFKTINLSYNLPSGSLGGVEWIRNATLYMSLDNLITFTNYSGFDPEVDLYSTDNARLGVDNGGYPTAKSVRLGVKLGF